MSWFGKIITAQNAELNSVRKILDSNVYSDIESVRKQLEQAASDWNKAEQIRRFAEHLERIINEIPDEEKKEKLFKWLKWARDKADWLDPLMAREDELLGRNKHIFELIECEDI